jgi:hypothetical protein
LKFSGALLIDAGLADQYLSDSGVALATVAPQLQYMVGQPFEVDTLATYLHGSVDTGASVEIRLAQAVGPGGVLTDVPGLIVTYPGGSAGGEAIATLPALSPATFAQNDRYAVRVLVNGTLQAGRVVTAEVSRRP